MNIIAGQSDVILSAILISFVKHFFLKSQLIEVRSILAKEQHSESKDALGCITNKKRGCMDEHMYPNSLKGKKLISCNRKLYLTEKKVGNLLYI